MFFPFLLNNVHLVPTAPAVNAFSFCNAVIFVAQLGGVVISKIVVLINSNIFHIF